MKNGAQNLRRFAGRSGERNERTFSEKVLSIPERVAFLGFNDGGVTDLGALVWLEFRSVLSPPIWFGREERIGCRAREKREGG